MIYVYELFQLQCWIDLIYIQVNNTVHNLSVDMAPCCHVLTLKFIILQRPQVTSLLGAERLWERGFTGKKVKMAIFDTGIRADHPHFRNIKVLLLLYLANFIASD
jgi:subtilisin family serine protease